MQFQIMKKWTCYRNNKIKTRKIRYRNIAIDVAKENLELEIIRKVRIEELKK